MFHRICEEDEKPVAGQRRSCDIAPPNEEIVDTTGEENERLTMAITMGRIIAAYLLNATFAVRNVGWGWQVESCDEQASVLRTLKKEGARMPGGSLATGERRGQVKVEAEIAKLCGGGDRSQSPVASFRLCEE